MKILVGILLFSAIILFHELGHFLLAKKNGLHSIGFPLISAGIFGYPLDGAWRKAIQACNDFIQNNSDYEIKIIFAVLDDKILVTGEKTLSQKRNNIENG